MDSQSKYLLNRASRIHAAIKAHFLRYATEKEWEEASQNPQKFNQAWRRMLGLTPGTEPPPKNHRT